MRRKYYSWQFENVGKHRNTLQWSLQPSQPEKGAQSSKSKWVIGASQFNHGRTEVPIEEQDTLHHKFEGFVRFYQWELSDNFKGLVTLDMF